MRQIISLVLIIGGVILIAIPFIGRYRTKQLQEEMLEEFYANAQLEQNNDLINSQSSSKLNDIFKWGDEEENQCNITPLEVNDDVVRQVEELNEATADNHSQNSDENSHSEEENANNSDTTNNNSSNLSKKPKIKQKPKAIAVIKIDKIGVNLPIANGIDLETLKYAIGYMPESGKLGEIGNAVLAGHRSHTYGVFFNRLNELEQGDKIVINTRDKEYVYTIYEKKIVEPDDISVMRGSSKFKVITLITCDPVIGATHRLIIHGVME